MLVDDRKALERVCLGLLSGKAVAKRRVENAMGLLWDWFPKRRALGAFEKIEKKLVLAVNALKNRQRKKLGWLTTNEVYAIMKECCIS